MVLLICYLVLILAYIICGLGVIKLYESRSISCDETPIFTERNLAQFLVILFWPFLVLFIGLERVIDG